MARYKREDGKYHLLPGERLGEGRTAFMALLIAIISGAVSFELGAEALGYEGNIEDDIALTSNSLRVVTGVGSAVFGLITYGFGRIAVGSRKPAVTGTY